MKQIKNESNKKGEIPIEERLNKKMREFTKAFNKEELLSGT